MQNKILPKGIETIRILFILFVAQLSKTESDSLRVHTIEIERQTTRKTVPTLR